MGLQSSHAPADMGAMGERGDMLKRLQKWPAIGVTVAAAVVGGVVGSALVMSGGGPEGSVQLVDAEPTVTAEPTAPETAEPAPVEPSAPAPVESEPAATVEPVKPQPAPEPEPVSEPLPVQGQDVTRPTAPLPLPSPPSGDDVGGSEGWTQNTDG